MPTAAMSFRERRMKPLAILSLLLAFTGCSTEPAARSFASDVDFLKGHTEVILLRSVDGQSQVAVAPAYQGRVMTSTAAGPSGRSFGWINRELIASGKTQEHINVYGGEDRFWLGPEGGPFSIFFAKDVKQELANWYTPAPIDTEPFQVAAASPTSATFTRAMHLTNASGTSFDLRVERTIQLLSAQEALKSLNAPPSGDARIVAYESRNTITNTGGQPWIKQTGLLSIWILGMFNPSDSATIVVPIKPGSGGINSNYFGQVPPDRLVVKEGDNGGVIYFRGDGKYRSKIGVAPSRARPRLGSYDAATHTLTLVQFNLPEREQPYVNSVWGSQAHPFAGDAVNSYNDGPPAPGTKPLGPFYELETSSPAAALSPGQSLTHVHRTIHVQGNEGILNEIARVNLGVGLDEIRNAFQRQ
jgi:hypothetical protein